MKPFLKWAGGKYKLLKEIKKRLPKGKRLIEPFVGAGSVFLNIDFDKYLICDSNEDLINLYKIIQNQGPDFIEYSKAHYFDGSSNSENKYKELRDKFNSIDKSSNKIDKSALFLYLNKHCFNGLCRYNSKGLFNVPFGKVTPYFPEKEIQYFYKMSHKVEFACQDFTKTMDLAIKGDVVYIDPPYATQGKNFTSYAQKDFIHKDQQNLIKKIIEIQNKGIPVLVSNSDTEWVINKYKKDSEITRIDVRRTISAIGSQRKMTGEVLALFK